MITNTTNNQNAWNPDWTYLEKTTTNPYTTPWKFTEPVVYPNVIPSDPVQSPDTGLDELIRRVAEIKKKNQPDPMEVVKRLMEFMSIPEDLRELLISLARSPADTDIWEIIADRLEELGMQTQNENFRNKAKKLKKGYKK